MELTPVLRTTKAGQPCTLPPAMATITLVSGGGVLSSSLSVVGILKGTLYFASAPVRGCSFLFLLCQSCQLWTQDLSCVPAGRGAVSVLGLYWCRGKGVLPPSSSHQAAQEQWHCTALCWILLHCCANLCPCLSKEADELNRSTCRAAWWLPHGPVGQREGADVSLFPCF